MPDTFTRVYSGPLAEREAEYEYDAKEAGRNGWELVQREVMWDSIKATFRVIIVDEPIDATSRPKP